MNRLSFDPASGEYTSGEWTAVCVIGPKALVSRKRGKSIVCGVLSQGKITEKPVGSQESLGGPWRATTKGWVLDE